MSVDKGFDSEYSGGLKTELTLALPGTLKLPAKRGYIETVDLNVAGTCSEDESTVLSQSSSSNRVQVVGWPPVRSFRKKIMKNSSGKYVKVAVDGAPYLRKVDLEMYSGYKELLAAFEDMFTSLLLTISSSSSCSATTDDDDDVLMKMTEYVPTYEDRDGDWMLVGDVPWKMFVESCKRLRMMKSSEATGLGYAAASKTISSKGSNIH